MSEVEEHTCYNHFPTIRNRITFKGRKIQIWMTGVCDKCGKRYKALRNEYSKTEELYGCMLYDMNWKDHPMGAKLYD